MELINLQGKVIITGKIKAVTGLRIGGAETGLEIGGVDNVIVRDPVTNKPYIPGSSLKGKIRSLMDKALGKPLKVIVKGKGDKPDIRIHRCESEKEYRKEGKSCQICRIFGLPGEYKFSEPTRLMVRDAFLDKNIEVDPEGKITKPWEEVKTDLPYSEVKWEAVIDRITSAATPRQMERVPAGALFNFEMVYDVYDPEDKENLKLVFQALRLLEDDYLGSSGARGSGQVKIKDLEICWKEKTYYERAKEELEPINKGYTTPEKVIEVFDTVIKGKISFKEG